MIRCNNELIHVLTTGYEKVPFLYVYICACIILGKPPQSGMAVGMCARNPSVWEDE